MVSFGLLRMSLDQIRGVVCLVNDLTAVSNTHQANQLVWPV